MKRNHLIPNLNLIKKNLVLKLILVVIVMVTVHLNRTKLKRRIEESKTK